jgi:hypothetical protein
VNIVRLVICKNNVDVWKYFFGDFRTKNNGIALVLFYISKEKSQYKGESGKVMFFLNFSVFSTKH